MRVIAPFIALACLFTGSIVTGKTSEEPKAPSLAIQIKTIFPASEIFGTKLVNGRPTKAFVAINNHEKQAVNVQLIGGALWTTAETHTGPSQIVRNLTTQQYGVEIPAGEQETLTYAFSTELHPQDLRLSLVAIVQDSKGTTYTATAFNETVAIVEPETSIFDPQIIFLYLLLASLFVGTVYFIYSTWITTFFPQAKKPRYSKADRAKAGKSEQTESVDGGSGKAKSTTYDESWLPEGHLKRPEQKRSKSGTPKKK